MEIPNATVIVSVQDNHKQFLKTLKNNLDKSGVRFELYIVSSIKEDFKWLKPVSVIYDDLSSSGAFNGILADCRTENLIFIQDPFLGRNDWAKKMIILKSKLQSCGILNLAFTDYIGELNLTHSLNKDFELEDVYVLEDNIYCGTTLITKNEIQLLGAFNKELPLKTALLEYGYRVSRFGFQNYVSLELCIGLIKAQKEVFVGSDLTNLTIPLREFTAVEEMAYHDLDNLFFHNKMNAEKFMFEFTGVFGFRTDKLCGNTLTSLKQFAIRYGLEYEIKSLYLSVEQNLNKNVWVSFSQKR